MLLVFFTLFSLFSQGYAASRIEAIQVLVEVKNGTVDAAVLERIKESVRAITEKVFLGQEIPQAQTMKEEAVDTMQKILNRVITGFYVESLEIEIGELVIVKTVIVPEDQVVEKVKVELDPVSVHPFWHPVLKKRASLFLPQLEPILKGIPVKAQEWAVTAVVPVLKARLDVERAFPGFNTEVQVNIEKETIISIRLIPQDPVVEKTYVSVESDAFPHFARAYLKFKLNQESAFLIGLPVQFLKKNYQYLENYWQKKIMGEHKEKYGLTVTIKSEIESYTHIHVKISASSFRIFVEGLINGGNTSPNPELRGMGWWKFGANEHVALRLVAAPAELALQAQVGIFYRYQESIAFGGFLELNTLKDMEWLFWQRKKWQLEGFGQTGRKNGEISVGYWWNPFVRLDLVSDANKGESIRVAIRF